MSSKKADSDRSLSHVLNDFWLTLKLVWSVNSWLILMLIGLEAVNGFLPAWLSMLLKQLINTLVYLVRIHDQDLHPVIELTFLLLGGWILDQVLDVVANVVIQRLKEQTDLHVRLRIANKVSTLDLVQLEGSELQNTLSLASQAVGYAPLEAVHYLATAIRSLVMVLSLGVVLWQIGGWFIPVGLCLAGLPFSAAEVFGGWIGYWTLRRNTPQIRQTNYIFSVLTSIDNFMEVKLYGITSLLIGRFQSIWEDLSEKIWKMTGQRITIQVAAGLLWNGAVGATYIYVGSHFLAGYTTIGELTQYITVMTLFRQAVQGMMQAAAKIYGATLLTGSLSELERYRPLITLPTGSKPTTVEAREGGLQIEFQKVSFEYTPGQPVLSDVSFTLQAGKATTLVGLNGAGKTTIVKLLMGFYEATSGTILVNGKDIRTYDLDVLRSKISAVLQNFQLFDFSLGENIGVGYLPQIENQELIEEAAHRSHFDKVIAALPDGYQTLLGNTFKTQDSPASTRLSGGQRQLLALARAMFRSGGLLILDEWTSSLDPIAVATLLQDFEEAMQQSPVTRLLISHTLSVAKKSDHIIVLEGGCIIEQGTHAELMQLNGRYAQLFEMQAAQYR